MNSGLKVLRLATRTLKLAITRPARLSHVFGTALAASDEVICRSTDLLRFRSVAVEDLLPDAGEVPIVKLALFPKTHASLSTLEAVCLILLIKKAKAASIFEFGTYKGVSITQCALNLPEDSRIYTLDLPEQASGVRFAIPDPDERQIALEPKKGSAVPAALRPRIQFLKQDSARFDAQSFAGRMDFVFVDGAHSADYVRNDSEKGWQMLRPGGIIAWHDCRPADPDVVAYLLQSPFNPIRIGGTSLAFAIKP